MLADTSAIHAFDAAQARHAETLDEVGAVLATAHPDVGALGPAGARFTLALTEAVQRQTELIAQLGESVVAAGITARANAIAYATADAEHGRSLSATGS